MNATTALPARTGYTTQQAFPDATAQAILDAALDVVADKATRPALSPDVPFALVDYLAARVEGTSPESFDLIWGGADEEGATTDAVERVRHNFQGMRSEAARAILVALGIYTGNLAPIDYPTVSRYWIACRNAVGAMR